MHAMRANFIAEMIIKSKIMCGKFDKETYIFNPLVPGVQ